MTFSLDSALPKKQKQILQTAEDLFQRFGIKRIPVEEICKTAGVSKMTFYKYFKNKNELVHHLWEKMFEEGMQKFDEIDRMDISFLEKIEMILELKEKSAAKISHEYALDYFNGIPELQSFFNEMYKKSISRFIEFISEAQKKGEVRPDMRPAFFITAISKLTELVHNKELVQSYPDYKDFVMEVNNFLFYGIMPRTVRGAKSVEREAKSEEREMA